MDKILHAIAFAARAHADQRRKYTGEPYLVHCLDVARMVGGVSQDEDDLCAAVLHDTLEDTATTAADLEREFGPRVRSMVEDLSDHFPPSPGGPNRARRKALEAERLAATEPPVQTIKLADATCNATSIAAHGRGFASVYLREMAVLLAKLQHAHPRIRTQAQALLADIRKRPSQAGNQRAADPRAAEPGADGDRADDH